MSALIAVLLSIAAGFLLGRTYERERGASKRKEFVSPVVQRFRTTKAALKQSLREEP